MPGSFLLSPAAVFIDPNQQTVQSNATLTASGSQVFTGFGNKQLTVVVNVKAAPTGTTPSLVVTIQEVDPGDQTTVIGTAVSTAAFTAAGVASISLPATMGGAVKVTWTITGTGSPTFTQVYITLSAKVGGPMVGQDSGGVDRALLVDASGRPIMVGAGVAGTPAGGVASVQGVAGGTALPVSAASLPLPSNAAQETGGNLASIKTDLDNISTHQTDGTQKAITRGGAKGTTAAADLTSNPVDANTQALHVDGSKVTQPVSAASLPLPSNAAQETGGHLANLDTHQTDGTQKAIARGGAKGTTTAADITSNPVDANTQAMHVDGSKVTQPVSAASLPLPTGAATAANQTNASQKSQLVDGSGNVAQVLNAAPGSDTGQSALAVRVISQLGAGGGGGGGTVISPDQVAIQANTTITANGNSTVQTGYGYKEVCLVVNVKNAPTGTNPTLNVLLQELDPGDQSTVLQSGILAVPIRVAGRYVIDLPYTKSGVFQVSWTVSGTTPSFSGVYMTLTAKLAAGIPYLEPLTNNLTPVFNETFDYVIGPLDTNQWTQVIAVGGFQTVSNGYLDILSTAGANTFSSVIGVPLFKTKGRALVFRTTCRINAAVAHFERFWGMGNMLGSLQSIANSTATAPVQYGVGFESIVDGATYRAAYYAQGALVQSQNITVPIDGAFHVYQIIVTDDAAYFFIDDMSSPVATLSLMTLASTAGHGYTSSYSPAYVLAVDATGAGTNNCIIDVQTSHVLASAQTATRIVDATYPWRGASVDVAGNLNVSAQPKEDALAAQNAPNYTSQTAITFPFDKNIAWGKRATAAVTPVVLGPNAFGQPIASGGNLINVVSSSASDAAAGTGARTLVIRYIDANGGKNVITITLNGTTTVSTSVSPNCSDIEDFFVLTSGSGGSNAGTITVTVAGVAIAVMAVNDNHWNYARHIVPTGKTCLINQVRMNANGVSGYGYLATYDAYFASATFTRRRLCANFRVVTGQNEVFVPFDPPIPIKVTSFLWAPVELWVVPDAATAGTFWGGFSYYEQ